MAGELSEFCPHSNPWRHEPGEGRHEEHAKVCGEQDSLRPADPEHVQPGRRRDLIRCGYEEQRATQPYPRNGNELARSRSVEGLGIRTSDRADSGGPLLGDPIRCHWYHAVHVDGVLQTVPHCKGHEENLVFWCGPSPPHYSEATADVRHSGEAVCGRDSAGPGHNRPDRGFLAWALSPRHEWIHDLSSVGLYWQQ
ncbi:hypothetical protein [Bromus-associated circular DNA virus 4]|uniref:Uncharacterized protein n=1 Tax=Bromus-associated circular DNA virus 4 TaxID=1590172 RepID=A0A0B4U7A6_9VIRU|nr:hypothetical protein [Bromus-associated circular DNA virus 4]AJC52535.1 hypothetical protein [Bromus-associated circular DNA virus 4]